MGKLSTFYFLGQRENGECASGEIFASDEENARQQLRRQGIRTALVRQETAIRLGRGKIRCLEKKWDEAKLVAFTHQLAVLLRSGLPLVRSLQILERQEINPSAKAVLASMASGLIAGHSFHGILHSYPQIFDSTYCQMVEAGDCAGDLGSALENIVEFRSRMLRTKRRTVSALFYPFTVLAVAFVTILFLSIHVIPKFEAMLTAGGSGQRLPAITRGMIAMSAFLRGHMLSLLLGIFAAVAAVSYFLRTIRGQIFFGRIALAMPFLGKLFLMQNLVIFLQTFGLLLKHAAPFTDALLLAADSIPNLAMKKYFRRLADRVRGGELLADLLAHSPYMLPFIHGLMAVGEETGRLSPMLLQASDALSEELNGALERATAMVQPILVLILAAVVATIAAAMFLPMTQMLQLSNF